MLEDSGALKETRHSLVANVPGVESNEPLDQSNKLVQMFARRADSCEWD